MIENNILGTILAGGKSSRFGFDKSTVKLGDKTLLDHTLDKIVNKFSEILVVTNNNDIKINKRNIFLINDCIKGQLGPLVGVLSAMNWIKENKKKYSWIATFPCDTPFFNISAVDELIKKSIDGNKKLYFLRSGDKRHNIFGIWSLKLRDTLEEDIKKKFRKVEDWANKIGLETINIDNKKHGNFININTKKEFEEAEQQFTKLK